MEISRHLSSICFRNTLMKACETVVAAAVIILGFGQAHAQVYGARLFHDKADRQFCHGINGDGRSARDAP
jgi:hypothetical protein